MQAMPKQGRREGSATSHPITRHKPPNLLPLTLFGKRPYTLGMKAQRRHELQHNVLADWLGRQLEVIKPYTTWILGGIIAVCAVAIVMQIIATRKANTRQNDWQKFYDAVAMTDPEAQLKALEKVESGPAGLWAHLSLGDLKLEQATSKYYTDQEASKKAVEEAKAHYLKVEESARRQPMLRQRATLGLAQAFETAGEFDKAKEQYAKLMKEDPESVFGQTASRQFKRLETSDLKELYDKIASYKPAPSKSTSPGLDGMPKFPGGGGLGGLGGLGGNPPDFAAPLPERPDLSLPGPSLDLPALDNPDDGKKPEVEETKPEESEKKADNPEEKPADPEKKPEGDKPDEAEKKPEGDK